MVEVRAPLIEVVLATHNGVRFLEEQILSIDRQTLRPQRLLISDDQSTDGTLELIQRLVQNFGPWLVLLPPSSQRLGCVANFARLLVATSAPYVALADQDDVWLPNKLELSFMALSKLEVAYGKEAPLLVHTDLTLIRSSGTMISPSYLSYQRIDPERSSSTYLSLTNVVSGCTVLLNRSCVVRSSPLPPQAAMHDWWLALVAAEFGAISCCQQSTVLYRQHVGNTVGATGIGWRYWLDRVMHLVSSLKSWPLGPLLPGIAQRAYFEHHFGLPSSALVSIFQYPRLRRFVYLPRLPRMHGPLRQLAFLCLVLLLPKCRFNLEPVSCATQ